ncbi:uncharacterized protein STEHIDRAFT_118739 [Stereum hirsutum FP-91666 SS1]|uniref:uncharacterized protein n=1 Tax=Stereum hirsutum (strain FP-91666) TaxID=721885 RepID=UPI000440D537|nr:uncharacterized protein STEHIDRAFT_118739 [Stereum hirsutum FP-91666 SS1]EIM89558.1 hypothetical protein STEHIDRAFT_118739 [Stereum hirsutum FP-91666 SS1]
MRAARKRKPLPLTPSTSQAPLVPSSAPLTKLRHNENILNPASLPSHVHPRRTVTYDPRTTAYSHCC